MRLISWSAARRAARNRTQCSSVTATETKSRTDSGTCRANFSFGQISHGRIHKSFHSVVDSMRLLCQMPRKACQARYSMLEFLGFSPRFDMRKILLGFFVCFCDISSTATTSACLHASRSFQFCGLRSNCDLAIYQPPPSPHVVLPTWHTHTKTHICLLNSVPYLWGQHQSPVLWKHL